MVAVDKFFEVLLVDEAIMYNVYNPSTKTLVITYKDTTFTCDLSSLSDGFPERRKYTLQVAGLYLYACNRLEFDETLDRDTILSNYMKFKLMEKDKSNLISLLLVSVPSFLLPIFSHELAINTQSVDVNIKPSSAPNDNIMKKENSPVTSILLVIAIIIIIILIYYTAHKK